MTEYRYGSHTVSRLTAHLVWITKYRYDVLKGDVQLRCRELIIRICDAEDVKILKGVVSKDHAHLLVEYPPSKAQSDLVKRLKGRTSRILQQEFPALRKQSRGRHFWASGYGAWSTGNVTEEVVKSTSSTTATRRTRKRGISSWSRTLSPEHNLCTFSAEWFGVLLLRFRDE